MGWRHQVPEQPRACRLSLAPPLSKAQSSASSPGQRWPGRPRVSGHVAAILPKWSGRSESTPAPCPSRQPYTSEM